MYMYQQKSTITNLLGKQHFNSNNEYIGVKNINRYIQQGYEIKLPLYTEQRWRLFVPSVVELFWWVLTRYRDISWSYCCRFCFVLRKDATLSLQRKFQRCWMHACYDALEVRHIFASNMFKNTTSKKVIFYVTFPYGHNARNPSNKMFCSDQVYFCFKTLLLSLKLVLRYFQGCWQSILYVKKCKLI